jgi:hypothetical protein
MSKRLSAEQKTFNKIYRHLLRQNERSADKDGICLYRGPRGLRCAAGVCIPNKDYNKNMENTNADGELVRPVLLKKGYHVKAAQDLQIIHDTTPVPQWQGALEHYAREHYLTIPAI